jgi:NADP-dependent 3-hydroxy acid dehydrogenase YdfG
MSKKTILITGATSGIGKSTAELLVSRNYKLVLVARRIEKLEELAARHPENIALVRADVTKKEEVQQMVDEALNRFGNIDVLINNAGIGYFNPIKDSTLEEWDSMIDTNIKGLLYCIHAVLPHMLKNEEGHIINLASVAAHNVFPNNVVYCSTKHAVHAISQGLRLELSDKIKVTTISPGAVNTEFLNTTVNEQLKSQYKNYFETALSPEHIAHNIVHCIEQPDEVVISEVIIRPNR